MTTKNLETEKALRSIGVTLEYINETKNANGSTTVVASLKDAPDPVHTTPIFSQEFWNLNSVKWGTLSLLLVLTNYLFTKKISDSVKKLSSESEGNKLLFTRFENQLGWMGLQTNLNLCYLLVIFFIILIMFYFWNRAFINSLNTDREIFLQINREVSLATLKNPELDNVKILAQPKIQELYRKSSPSLKAILDTFFLNNNFILWLTVKLKSIKLETEKASESTWG